MSHIRRDILSHPITSHITHYTPAVSGQWANRSSARNSQRSAMQCNANTFLEKSAGMVLELSKDPRSQDAKTGLDWTGLDPIRRPRPPPPPPPPNHPPKKNMTRKKNKDPPPPPGAISLAKWNTALHAYWRTASWRPGIFVASAKCSTLQLETNVQCCAGAQLKKNRGVPYRAERAVPPLRFQMHMH